MTTATPRARRHAAALDALVDAAQCVQLLSTAAQFEHGQDERQWPPGVLADVEQHRELQARTASGALQLFAEAERGAPRPRGVAVALALHRRRARRSE